MIKYEGLKNNGKVYYIVFSNDMNITTEIPIAKEEHDRIAIYLDKLSTFKRKVVERLNIDD